MNGRVSRRIRAVARKEGVNPRDYRRLCRTLKKVYTEERAGGPALLRAWEGQVRVAAGYRQ